MQLLCACVTGPKIKLKKKNLAKEKKIIEKKIIFINRGLNYYFSVIILFNIYWILNFFIALIIYSHNS